MADLIRLLPDTVANQIAAGEVIQRPASAVKEMLENAIDAGAGKIQLILLDAGKTLIQVIDDGAGMSDTDAMLCFERHATSKLRRIDDLFSLQTMGFRGEALASIASVAQVELRTRKRELEVGYKVEIEGGETLRHGSAAVAEGTSISVKNLFYNVPARRNFLKSNPVETRHIQEEFIRVALAHPDVHFTLHHNDAQVFDWRNGNLRQRIASVFGKQYNERLVPVEEETSIVRVEGYIGKPEFSRKNRGEQYFFVNDRFIRDNYLHHAVSSAFDALIPKDAYPSYWLKLYVDPSQIDVNIHPTKTEIKFSHDKDVYAILRAAVKRALGRYSVAPSLDFEKEPAFDLPLSKQGETPSQPQIRINPNYNPFRPVNNESGEGERSKERIFQNPSHSRQDISSWLQNHIQTPVQQSVGLTEKLVQDPVVELMNIFEELDDFRFVQVGQQLAVAAYKNGLVLFDLPAARERILFERHLTALQANPVSSQQQLFPPQIQLSPQDLLLFRELAPELRKLGFDVTEFGGNSIVFQGIPAELDPGSEQSTLQYLFEQFRSNKDRLQLPVHENLARSFARAIVARDKSQFTSREIRQMAIDLLHCDQPFVGVQGKRILRSVSPDQLQQIILSGSPNNGAD